MTFLASLETLSRKSRLYSVPYVAALGALGLASVVSAPEPSQWAAAALVGPLAWTLCVAANDHAHRAADQKTRPERQNWSLGWWALGLALGIVGLLCRAAAVSWGLCLGVIACAVGYGLSKSWPVVALALRGASGGALVLLGASLGSPERVGAALAGLGAGDRKFLMIALLVALADLIGNLLGDVRDRENDERAGTSTLATRSRTGAILLAALLHCALLAAVLAFVPSAAPRLALGICGLSMLWGMVRGLADASLHLGYLAWKYLLTASLFASMAQVVPTWMMLLALLPALAVYRRSHPHAWPALRAATAGKSPVEP